MIALYILLGLLALIFAAIIIPVKVEFGYKDFLVFKVKYLVTVFDSAKSKTENRKKRAKKTKGEQKPKKGIIKDYFKSYDSILEFFNLLKAVLVKFKKFIKKVRVYNTILTITVAGDDAAETALKYGSMCAAVYPALTLMSKTVIFEPEKISVSTDFTSPTTKISIYTDISVKPIYIIKFTISVLWLYIKSRLERTKK